MTTFKSSSTGSSQSKASILFGLDEEDKSNILVYRYRSGSSGLEVSTQHDLCRELDSDPQLPLMRVTKKEIPRGNSRVDISREDLLLPEELEEHRDRPTLNTSVANVGIPHIARIKRLLFNSFPELYIVHRSPTSSAANSRKTSPESSQHVTPTGTFEVDTPHPLQDPTSNP